MGYNSVEDIMGLFAFI